MFRSILTILPNSPEGKKKQTCNRMLSHKMIHKMWGGWNRRRFPFFVLALSFFIAHMTEGWNCGWTQKDRFLGKLFGEKSFSLMIWFAGKFRVIRCDMLCRMVQLVQPAWKMTTHSCIMIEINSTNVRDEWAARAAYALYIFWSSSLCCSPFGMNSALLLGFQMDE